MNNYFIALMLLLSYHGSAQLTSTITYSPTAIVINNPERGFYRHTETHSSGYTNLDQTALNGYRSNNTTLILRVFYLENFISAPISSAYLNAMQADFNKIRIAGLKCVVRFAYSDSDTAKQRDASKAQILSHILQLKPLLETNADIISVMQAGFIGSWGEWYYTDYFGINPTATDYANRKEVIDAILSALPNSRMIQVRTPLLKQKTFNTTTALTQSQAYNNSALARVGHHNDCFLASPDDFGTYSNVSSEYAYLAQETKYTPMGGETCAVNEPRSACPTALSEMEKFHWSYLNLDYNPNVISGFQSGDCFKDIQNRLGYRFELLSGLFPQTATIGSAINITLKIKNNGFAAPYNPRMVYLVFRSTSNNQEYAITFNTNPRLWAGGVTQTISENLTLPADIVAGNYKLYLKIPDSNEALSKRPEYSIRMANESVWESATGYNSLMHTISVGGSLALIDQAFSEMKLYPVPTDNELIVELNTISDYSITIYNFIGQRVGQSDIVNTNKLILNTQNLNNGIYFVQFQNKESITTKKIIVKH